jgi:hypothetical protein
MHRSINNADVTISQAKFITRKGGIINIMLLFLVQPFIALLVAIKNYKSNYAKNVVWFFVIFYGFTFVISNKGMDANRYRDRLIEMSKVEMTLDNFISGLYTEDTKYVDVAQPLITFILSRFTSNPRILFAVFGLIFGYFYSRNIWYLIDRAGPIIKRVNIPLIFTFAFIIGFWSINGFRMYTAAHIFFFGAIKYLMEDKKKGIVIAATSILFHFSFMLPVAILTLFTILRNRVHLYFWFFIATFFITELNLGGVREILTKILPDIFHSKVIAYTHEGILQARAQSFKMQSWHARYYGQALQWVVIVMISIIYFKGLTFIKADKILLPLLGFSFLFLGVANIADLVPSGGRFTSVANLFAVGTIFFYLQYAPKERLMRWLMPIALPALLLYCIVAIRVGFDTIGVLTIIGNPIIALFGNINVALIELIK